MVELISYVDCLHNRSSASTEIRYSHTMPWSWSIGSSWATICRYVIIEYQHWLDSFKPYCEDIYSPRLALIEEVSNGSKIAARKCVGLTNHDSGFLFSHFCSSIQLLSIRASMAVRCDECAALFDQVIFLPLYDLVWHDTSALTRDLSIFYNTVDSVLVLYYVLELYYSLLRLDWRDWLRPLCLSLHLRDRSRVSSSKDHSSND